MYVCNVIYIYKLGLACKQSGKKNVLVCFHQQQREKERGRDKIDICMDDTSLGGGGMIARTHAHMQAYSDYRPVGTRRLTYSTS